MRKGKPKDYARGRRGLHKKRIRAFDSMRSVEFCSDSRQLRPAEKLSASTPKQQVVDEMGERITHARIEDDMIANHQTSGPLVASKVARRSWPERSQRGFSHRAKFTCQ